MSVWHKDEDGNWQIFGFARSKAKGDPYACLEGVSNLGPVEAGAINDAAWMMHHGGTEESAEEFRYLGGYAGIDSSNDYV